MGRLWSSRTSSASRPFRNNQNPFRSVVRAQGTPWDARHTRDGNRSDVVDHIIPIAPMNPETERQLVVQQKIVEEFLQLVQSGTQAPRRFFDSDSFYGGSYIQHQGAHNR